MPEQGLDERQPMAELMTIQPVKRITIGLAMLGVVVTLAYAEQCSSNPYDCALYHVERRQFSEAIGYLEEILRSSPRDLKALNLLGISLTTLGEIEEANKQFKKALEYEPRFYPALKNLAINELASNKTDVAKSHFEKVLEYAPEDEIAHLSLAEILYQSRECGLALKHYDKVRMRIVNSPLHILHFSECSLRLGRRRQALTFLELLPAHDGESQFAAGLLLTQAEAYAAAAKHFGQARQGYHDPYSAGYNQTLAYLRAGEFPSAIRTANELIAGGHQHAELYNLLSEAFVKTDQVQEAYDALRTATQLDPRDEDNYIDLAAMCLERRNYDLASEIATIGLAHLPFSYRLHVQRGIVKARKGLFVEAEEDFAAAAELAPEEPLPHVALGTVQMETGQLQESIEVLRKGARQNPEDFLVQYMFGRALLQSGAVPGDELEKEAFAALETSVRLNPNFWRSRAALGKMLMKRGDVDRAVEELEMSSALNPDSVETAYPLAQAYRKKGDLARARELLDRVGKIHAVKRETTMKYVLKKPVRKESPTFIPSQTTQ